MNKYLKKSLLLIVAVTAIFALQITVAPANQNTQGKRKTHNLNYNGRSKLGEVIVKFKPSVSKSQQANILRSGNATTVINDMSFQQSFLSNQSLKKEAKKYRKKKKSYKKKRNKYTRVFKKLRVSTRKKSNKKTSKRMRAYKKKILRLDKRWKRYHKSYRKKIRKLKRKRKKSSGSMVVVKTNAGTSVSASINVLKRDRRVEFAEPNYILGPQYVPNDTNFRRWQWNMHNTGQLVWGSYGKPDADIDAPEGWNVNRGTRRRITVAVIDSGMDFNHPDLTGRIWTNADEIAGNGKDDDGNGYVDDRNGYNWAGISQTYDTGAEWNLGERVDENTRYPYGFQTITGTGQILRSLTFKVAKEGRPQASLIVNIYQDSCTGGSRLSGIDIHPWEVGEDFAAIRKKLNPAIRLESGRTYCMWLITTDFQLNHYYRLAYNAGHTSPADLYPGGQFNYFKEDTDDSANSEWLSDEELTFADPLPDEAHDDLYFETNGNPYPLDDNGHGTHVSGIVGARTNNSRGVAGVTHGAKIMPLKSADSSGLVSASDAMQAVYYAVNNGAKVINMSLGSTVKSNALARATNDAYAAGVTVVAAAGNSGDATTYYPAGNNNVIGVGSTNNRDTVSSFSTSNPTVDVSAPGENIISTMPTYYVGYNWYSYNYNYDFMSGSSMASPHVAGLAALLRAKYSRYPVSKINLMAIHLSDDLGTKGRDNSYGFGRMNIRKALKGDRKPPRRIKAKSTTHKLSRKYYRNTKPLIKWSAIDSGSGVAGYSFALNRKPKYNPPKKNLGLSTEKQYTKIKTGAAYFHVRAVDYLGNWSKTKHLSVNIDTYKPRTSAAKLTSAYKGISASFNYKITEKPSNRPVKVTVKIKRKGKTYKNYRTGWTSANRKRAISLNNFPIGTYTYSIYAVDGAKNKQKNISTGKIRIKKYVRPRPTIPRWPISP